MSELLPQSPWTTTAVVAIAAALAALLARKVLRDVMKRLARGRPVILSGLDATRHAGRLAFPALALLMAWEAAPPNLPYLSTVRHLTVLLLIGSMTWFTMVLIGGLARGVLDSHPVDLEDNLQARRIHTQTNVLSRSAQVVVGLAGLAMALMTFPGARQVGASLLASAGVLGIIAGLAARPVFSNLIAGLQIALAQPIRIDDALIVKGEFGKVEEITGSYVVLKLWDERRMIVPLQWFIENPFENWTRTGANLLGSVFLYLDYATPIEPLRAEAERLVKTFPEWDGRVFAVQVTDATDRAIQVRVLVSAGSSGKAFDLRCKMREALIAFMAREYPQSLPVVRSLAEGSEDPEQVTAVRLSTGTRPG